MSFSSLDLSQSILDAVRAKGYTSPSPIQAQAIPAILEGRDVMAAAQTGTGKTAGFTLPLLEILSHGQPAPANHARALVLTPTRELAAQVEDSVKTYGSKLPLRSAVVFGGVKINPQMMKLRKGVDILVATPGRLLDLYGQNAVKFDQLEVLVLDEADRMLDMGFINDIKKILRLLPAKRQNLMFSATFSDEIRVLAKGLVHNPVEISVSPRNTTAASVTQRIHPVDKKRKPELLAELIDDHAWTQVLVFTRTKHGANKLARFLESQAIPAAAIHGNKSQGARTRALAEFKAGKLQVLVATDIAARGLDIDQLPHVVNFDLPNVPEDYVHRIGRTGRAGASGEAVSLVSADEAKQLYDIERLIKKTLPREYVDGFEPDHDIPESRGLAAQPHRPRKKPSQNAGRRNTQQRGKPRSDSKSGQSKSAGGGGGSSNARRKPNTSSAARSENAGGGKQARGTQSAGRDAQKRSSGPGKPGAKRSGGGGRGGNTGGAKRGNGARGPQPRR